jgi:hypothetical protein
MDASQRLRAGAAEVAALRTLDGIDAATRARRDELRAFQARRLAFTHADLLESPRYRAATRFFLDELYGVKDFSQRDAELARVIPTLTRFLPEAALGTIADAVELDALSERLDLATAKALVADPAIRGRPIDDDAYARAFRAAGSRTDGRSTGWCGTRCWAACSARWRGRRAWPGWRRCTSSSPPASGPSRR